MKAQTSVEFIMNYSWMLAIVGIVIAALFALGFFSENSWGIGSGKSGFGDLGPVDNGWKLEQNGTLFLKIRNSAASDLKIWTVKATIGELGRTYDYDGVEIGSGDDSALIGLDGLGNFQKGEKFKALIEIDYGTSDINFTSQGKVWGSAGN